jgi:prepilin-type N-terminal cleavage/methylation domain-containing protein/prepilin-type processing-associated H-X9-DG protein
MNKRGFTLIELLVVISIIAILMAVMMPALTKAREQAKQVICQNSQHSLATAVSLYSAENKNRMPPTIQGQQNGSTTFYTIPCRIKYFQNTSAELNGGSLIATFGTYLNNPEYLTCPLCPNEKNWKDVFAEDLADDTVTITNSAYFFLWNYPLFAEKDTRALLNTGDKGKDTLLLTDFLMTWGGDRWWIPHNVKGAVADNFDGKEGDSRYGKFWKSFKIFYAPDSGLDNPPKTKLNAAYLDGHVETWTAQDCRIVDRNNDNMFYYRLPPKWR